MNTVSLGTDYSQLVMKALYLTFLQANFTLLEFPSDCNTKYSSLL